MAIIQERSLLSRVRYLEIQISLNTSFVYLFVTEATQEVSRRAPYVEARSIPYKYVSYIRC